MAGCYGNDPYDRAMEKRLNDYLDYCENLEKIYCEECGMEIRHLEDCNTIEEDDLIWYECPHCKNLFINEQ